MTRLVEDERSKNFKIEILNFKRYNLVSFTITFFIIFYSDNNLLYFKQDFLNIISIQSMSKYVIMNNNILYAKKIEAR